MAITRQPCAETECPGSGYQDPDTCECVGGTDTTLAPTETQYTAPPTQAPTTADSGAPPVDYYVY